MHYICVFCGANDGKDPTYRRLAETTGQAIVKAGHGIVFGGGRVGLMGALADAALACGGQVIGVIPQQLADAEVAHTGLTQLHVVETMHERKALMAELSDAFLAMPGGYGTMDEFCEILTWRQLRIHDKPIGLLNHAGFYDDLLALFDAMTARGFVTQRNRSLFVAEPTVERLLAALPL